MSGWIFILVSAPVIFMAIRRFGGLNSGGQEILAAALLVALGGYAIQGQPSLQSAPASSLAGRGQEAVELIRMRSLMDDKFGPAKDWLVTADAFSRSGNYQGSANYIRAGLRKYPENADLWAALGLQVMLAGQGRISPPAKLAFDQAKSLAPDHPVPDYFTGLSTLFDGDLDRAVSIWEKLLQTAPERAEWRPLLDSQLAGLRKLREQQLQLRADPGPIP